MSHIVHSSDNLTIFWDITEKNSEKYLYLAFSIQINGKTRSFSFYFELIDAKEEDGQTWYLKEYREWYNVYELLGNIGYPVWNYSADNPMGWNIINTWIEDLLQSKEDKDTFYR